MGALGCDGSGSASGGLGAGVGHRCARVGGASRMSRSSSSYADRSVGGDLVVLAVGVRATRAGRSGTCWRALERRRRGAQDLGGDVFAQLHDPAIVGAMNLRAAFSLWLAQELFAVTVSDLDLVGVVADRYLCYMSPRHQARHYSAGFIRHSLPAVASHPPQNRRTISFQGSGTGEWRRLHQRRRLASGGGHDYAEHDQRDAKCLRAHAVTIPQPFSSIASLPL